MEVHSKLARTLAVALCAAFASGSAAQAQDVVPEARALLPASIVEKGVISVGGAMVWPPYQWIDAGGEYVGFEPDLLRLLAAKLGVGVEFADIKFATVIPSIESGRYDVATGQLGITKPRIEVVDFVPNSTSRLGLLTAQGLSGLDVNDLCGHTLAVTLGSVQATVVDGLSKTCVGAGKEAIKVNEYPDTPSSYLAVSSGRAEGFVVTRAVASYMAEQDPNMEVSDSSLDGFISLSGLMVSKNQPELKAALTAAMESALADGSYAAILDKYSIPFVAIAAEDLKKPLAEVAID